MYWSLKKAFRSEIFLLLFLSKKFDRSIDLLNQFSAFYNLSFPRYDNLNFYLETLFPLTNFARVINYKQDFKKLLHICIKSNLSLQSLYYAAVLTSLRGLSLHPGNTVPFEEMLQWWQAVGNLAFDLTVPRFEPLTFRSIDELVTARPTAILIVFCGKVVVKTK